MKLGYLTRFSKCIDRRAFPWAWYVSAWLIRRQKYNWTIRLQNDSTSRSLTDPPTTKHQSIKALKTPNSQYDFLFIWRIKDPIKTTEGGTVE